MFEHVRIDGNAKEDSRAGCADAAPLDGKGMRRGMVKRGGVKSLIYQYVITRMAKMVKPFTIAAALIINALRWIW